MSADHRTDGIDIDFLRLEFRFDLIGYILSVRLAVPMADENHLLLSLIHILLIRLVIRAPFLAAGAIVMAMLLDLKMSLIFLVAAPFLAGVIFLVMNRSIPFYRGIQKKMCIRDRSYPRRRCRSKLGCGRSWYNIPDQ